MILDSSFPPDPRVENEASALIRNGHSVYLLALDYTNTQAKEEKINNINVQRVFPGKIIYKLSALAYTIPFYHLYFLYIIKSFLRDNQIEAIHIHDIQISRAVFWANRQFQLPVTLDLHENRPEIMKYYSHVNSIIGKLLVRPRIWKKFEYKYIKKADKVIIVTESAAEYYKDELNISKEKFVIVPNTVTESFYKDPFIEDSIIESYRNYFTLLYLGDTGKRRGLEVAIKSINLIKKNIPQIKLCVIGSSGYDSKLKELIAEEGVEDFVDMHGWQDFTLFPSYIKACKIGICPLHKNIHHDTTYANKIIQTLSYGKPMLVSNSDAQKKLIEKYRCGLVFTDRNIQDFKEKVFSLYSDKELYTKYAENAKYAVENHLKWEILSNPLIHTYQSYERNKDQ